MRQCTLVFLNKPSEQKILLAMKKRGFGVGKWNGVGGKLQDGETLKDAAVRETREEIAVDMKGDDLINVAIIDFYFEDKKEFNQQVHVFITEKWQGDPVESEEMKPEWYSYDALPFDRMWIDDSYWLPLVIAGKKIKAEFLFDETGSRIIRQKVETL